MHKDSIVLVHCQYMVTTQYYGICVPFDTNSIGRSQLFTLTISISIGTNI